MFFGSSSEEYFKGNNSIGVMQDRHMYMCRPIRTDCKKLNILVFVIQRVKIREINSFFPHINWFLVVV